MTQNIHNMMIPHRKNLNTVVGSVPLNATFYLNWLHVRGI